MTMLLQLQTNALFVGRTLPASSRVANSPMPTQCVATPAALHRGGGGRGCGVVGAIASLQLPKSQSSRCRLGGVGGTVVLGEQRGQQQEQQEQRRRRRQTQQGRALSVVACSSGGGGGAVAVLELGAAAAATAAGAAGGGAAVGAAAGGEVMKAAATAAGFAVTAGSLLLFTPMIARVWSKRSADGLSVSTWALNLAGFAAGTIYPFSRGFPIAQFGDAAALTAQSAVLLAMIVVMRGILTVPQLCVCYGAFGAVCFALVSGIAPAWALAGLQAASTLMLTGALLPQIAMNYRNKSAGEWSAASAGMSTAGNAVKVFTTVQLAGGDQVLLAGFCLG
eukprot:CAMPEP_0197576806 /NCGR_PEP_ID=MMETSP1326-20131121/1680_1 /TAXON_ID=1155430 /ORGANISM="Genus nov. species nov., Strain RCC2288" /LENGTH=335 /DNA_ID=CAMNT_0043139779 /DNA_START=167 /DNA_END=1170 /DNA_ORIENTATION=+